MAIDDLKDPRDSWSNVLPGAFIVQCYILPDALVCTEVTSKNELFLYSAAANNRHT